MDQNIFHRLDRQIAIRTGELREHLKALLTEGMDILQTFGRELDTDTMRRLNGWWVRAEHTLTKCEKSLTPPPGKAA